MLNFKMLMHDKLVHAYGLHLIDPKALEQMSDCMNKLFAVRGAIMPDMHVGYDMPIGGVIETKGCVVPAWVGYDIGCGVCYVETDFSREDVTMLTKEIFVAVHQAVPTGVGSRIELTMDSCLHPPFNFSTGSDWFINNYMSRKGQDQIGTLGAGNHFIEIGTNRAGKVCFVIHSGSRGIGHSTATHYMNVNRPLIEEETHFVNYMKDHDTCLRFALENRLAMLNAVAGAIKGLGIDGRMKPDSLINKTHNHVVRRINHDGRFIHRKGATDAGLYTKGVIPGTPQLGSYVIRGRGNRDALLSSSHGAGRVGSRKKARATISMLDYAYAMQGVFADISSATLDEAPQAYKDFALVMAAQEDLVEVIDHVTPLICVKGVQKRKGKQQHVPRTF